MLLLNEDQKLLMESARGAVAAKAPIAEFRKLRADPHGDGFSPRVLARCRRNSAGRACSCRKTFGGIDFGVVGAGLIAREMAREPRALALPLDVRPVGERVRSRRARRRRRPTGCPESRAAR